MSHVSVQVDVDGEDVLSAMDVDDVVEFYGEKEVLYCISDEAILNHAIENNLTASILEKLDRQDILDFLGIEEEA